MKKPSAFDRIARGLNEAIDYAKKENRDKLPEHLRLGCFYTPVDQGADVDFEQTDLLMHEAADEIERLREALRRIVEYCANDGLPNEIVAERVIDRVDEEARSALKESGGE